MILKQADKKLIVIKNPKEISQCDIFICEDFLDIEKLFDHFKSVGYPKLIISDCIKIYHDIGIPFIGAHTIAGRFLTDYQKIIFDNNFETKYCANIFVNKKQMNRHLTLKFASILNISFDYIWNGINRNADFSSILEKQQNLMSMITNDQKTKLLSPLTLSKKWIDNSYGNQDPDTVDPNIFALPHGGNHVYSWNNFCKQLMVNSAVTIINENPDYQNCSHLSWKTIFSILALTFPIWAGGYRIADELKEKGFDIFDDIIDHSYQYKSTLFERCWYAFNDNLSILSDLDRATSLREKNKKRLLKNRQLFLNGTLYNNIVKEINDWNLPNSIKEFYIKEFLLKYNNSL
jgi:hypothetical protein